MLNEVKLICYSDRRNKVGDGIKKFANYLNNENFANIFINVTGGFLFASKYSLLFYLCC